jgi:hypothetical protein
VASTEMPSADNPPGSELVSSESWPHGLRSGRFDFRHERVESLFPSRGIPAFAWKIDAILDLLAHLFFLQQRKLASAQSELWRWGMRLVAASKKLIKFDPKTFLSTINGGRRSN